MLVNFYNNKSANNVVHKNIGSVISSQDCQIWDDVSIQQPVLLVDYSDSLIDANYCYIAKFKRYYYIVDSTVYDGSKLKLSLASDVLMSFWNSFSSSQCQAKRSSNKYNKDINDETRTYKPQPIYNPITVGNVSFEPSRNGSYVLTVGGK